ncbi:Heparan sulfate 2-O-sulfotransferase 1 [Elysia marginata]|uniref:Heparan sulfate 2-O-sulfotransferase 1 n=1 Tax=Elysia marginata TaxID=1093978 RepID=A0AAV4FY95_9GAST|nr:Heparan sulfate 2-O-sulfotransferase 1 [Elysia marginata]
MSIKIRRIWKRWDGNEWALQEAKRNLFRHYLVVGVTEELEDFISVLEVLLPRFYRGAKAFYTQGLKGNLRQTSKKIPPSQATQEKIKTSHIYRMEKEFYDFALQTFHVTKVGIFNKSEKIRYSYQKIRPE